MVPVLRVLLQQLYRGNTPNAFLFPLSSAEVGANDFCLCPLFRVTQLMSRREKCPNRNINELALSSEQLTNEKKSPKVDR